LYWFEPALGGTAIKVLATADSKQKGKPYPMVFTVEHPKGRVMGLTLGHDGDAHNLPPYIQLLRNSVMWCAGKETK
jgi:type 1 glutamine amidotransferase